MHCNHPFRSAFLVRGAIGIGLISFALAPATLAGASVMPPGTGSSGPCTTYPLASGGNVQAFVNAAEAAHKTGALLCVAAGLSLHVSAPVTVTEPVSLDFNGATISKTSAMDNWAMTVTAANVSVTDLTIKGNEAAGAEGGGMLCEAADCVFRSVHVSGMTTDGIQVAHTGSSLTLASSTVSDTISTLISSGEGIDVSSGAVLHATGTSSTDNTGSGYYLMAGGSGSTISGTSADNRQAGLMVGYTPDVTVGTFDSSADWHYGVEFSGATGAQVGPVTATDTGAAENGLPVNSTGSGVALFDTTGSTFASLSITGMPGFGLMVAESSKNTFDDVTIDRGGPGISNPGINLDHESADNVFVKASITDTSVGVNIGGSGAKNDPDSRNGNTDNQFQLLDCTGNTYADVNIGGGTGNVFTTVNATDIRSNYPAPGRAAIRLDNTETSDNTITTYNSYVNGSYPVAHDPFYLIYADTSASQNSVHLGTVQGGYKVAKFLDSNGSNTFN
jgi:hypothetical protein